MKISAGHRQIGAQFTVAVAVCGAAYYFLVQPAKQELGETRAKVSSLLTSFGATSSAATKITEDQINNIQDETRARIDLINRRSAPARNEAELFASVSELAKKYNVRVNQLQPTALNTKGRPGAPAGPGAPTALAPAAPPEPGAPPPPKDSSVGYTISVLGSYADLTAFVDALPRDLGFTIVSGAKIQIAHEGSGELLQAEIRTEHFAFDAAQIPSAAGVSAAPPAAAPPTAAPAPAQADSQATPKPATPKPTAQTAAHGPEHAP